MYTNVTEDFVTAIQSDGRTFRAKMVREDGSEITDGFKKVTCTAMSGNGTDAMQLGCATATQISVELYDPDIAIGTEELRLDIGLILPDGNIEYVPVGYFTPVTPTNLDGKITFTAYDRMTSKMDKEYISKLSYPAQIEDICNEIEEMAGITMVNKPSGFTVDRRVDGQTQSSGSSSGTTIVYSNPFDGYTFKESVAFITGRVGKFATFNRDGKLEFRYFSNAVFTVDTDVSNSDVLVASDLFTLGYLRCTVDSSLVLTSGTGTTGATMNCFLHTQETLDTVFATIGGMNFYPTTVSFMGDLRLDIGDIVQVEERNGNIISLPIMSLSLTYDGGLTTAIGSYGNTSDAQASVVSPTQKELTRMYQKIAVVESLIVKDNLTVGDLEKIFSGGTNILNNSQTMGTYEVTASDDPIGDMQESVGKALALGSNISTEYDTITAYKVGDFCIKDNVLYKCIQDASGAFATSYWEQITVGQAMSEIRQEVNTLNDDLSKKINDSLIPIDISDSILLNDKLTDIIKVAYRVGNIVYFNIVCGTTWSTDTNEVLFTFDGIKAVKRFDFLTYLTNGADMAMRNLYIGEGGNVLKTTDYTLVVGYNNCVSGVFLVE